jgi:hypothetical protein
MEWYSLDVGVRRWINLIGEDIDLIKRNREALLYASTEVGLEQRVFKPRPAGRSQPSAASPDD